MATTIMPPPLTPPGVAWKKRPTVVVVIYLFSCTLNGATKSFVDQNEMEGWLDLDMNCAGQTSPPLLSYQFLY
ncbi:hypothetical protein [Ralstonia pseudosolanacearum]|uniref:hypothetical protein n=1 Tax=Ralstonia pseudosolanacearum TaxID=1310165 RepID=UPI001FF7B436|nr:hypothetical protein [Ralstonia pseudosolanacearum]